jgi:hypothetical protein
MRRAEEDPDFDSREKLGRRQRRKRVLGIHLCRNFRALGMHMQK